MHVAKRVLVIEDDPDYADFIEMSLRPYMDRYKVDYVDRYEDALTAIQDDRHDVYLSDYNLDSEHTGMDLINETSSRLRPLVLITGGDNSSLGDEAVRNGACDFVLKSRLDGMTLDRILRNSLIRSDRMVALVKRQEELQGQLNRDPLTGLASRFALKQRIDDRLHAQDAQGGMLYLDLDGFKQINDRFGHSIGDQLLQRVSRRLIKSVQPNDIVGRLGGDEFLIYFSAEKHGQSVATKAQNIAQTIIRVVSEPYALEFEYVTEKTFVRVCASIGIALAPQDSTRYEQLIQLSDQAMYRAKANGRNGHVFASPPRLA